MRDEGSPQGPNDDLPVLARAVQRQAPTIAAASFMKGKSSMRRMLRARNVFLLLFFLLAEAVVVWIGEFVYRLNNDCGTGEHLIQSEADAIETEQGRVLQARYGAFDVLHEKPAFVDFSHADNCCTAPRTRNIYGVIVWEVLLNGEAVGEPVKRYVSAQMSLSNCGAVFKDDSFMTAEQTR
jgi:hypothetical protein